MLKKCEHCGKRLSLTKLFSSNSLCDECQQIERERREEFQRTVESLQDELMRNINIQPQHEQIIKQLDGPSGIKLYNALFNHYEADNELSSNQISVLQQIQNILELTNEEIEFSGKIAPYIYLDSIRRDNSLPKIELGMVRGGRFVLQQNETIHFMCSAFLYEMRTVSLGYRGGSHGISIPLVKGVRYRVGTHKGQLVKEDRMMQTSSGNIVITSKRIILHPYPGNKPYSMPLNKLNFYQCYESGVEMFRDGRQKGLYFKVGADNVDIIELCLNFLTQS